MDELGQLLDKLDHPRVLVVGDLILDRYTWGNADRVSPEAPVLVLKADDEEVRLGGAASVANLLNALEARVSLAGVVGNDADGRVLCALLDDSGIEREGVLVDGDRPTPCKERFIGRAAQRHPHQILRVDHEDCHALAATVERELLHYLSDALALHNVVLISDYAKGVCSPALLGQLIAEAKRLKIPVLVDPARGADYSRYREATLIAPNRAEAALATGIAIKSPSDALQAGKQIHDRFGIKTVVVKLDSDGMALVHDGKPGRLFDAREREVYDVTGAGDMVLAMLGLCRGSGLCWANAVRLANVAAGLEVEKTGVVPITRSEIRCKLEGFTRQRASKIVSRDEMVRLAERYRHQGKSLVFTNGCLDLLHLGHVTYLLEAAGMGDVLVVAINSDASVQRLKGSGRPLMNEQDRAVMLAALECVDHVLIFDEDTPHELLRQIRPDVLVKGGTTDEIVGQEVVEAYGGRVCRAGRLPGLSTTTIVNMIRDACTARNGTVPAS